MRIYDVDRCQDSITAKPKHRMISIIYPENIPRTKTAHRMRAATTRGVVGMAIDNKVSMKYVFAGKYASKRVDTDISTSYFITPANASSWIMHNAALLYDDMHKKNRS